MKAIYSCLFLSTIIFVNTSHAAAFSPISWAFKSGEKAKMVVNATSEIYYVQINVQTGGIGVTVDGGDPSCSNLHLNENGLNTAVCKFGAHNTLYIDNDNEYGLASGTYQVEQ